MQPGRWERIERLYHEAREKNAGNRVAFLDEACAGDDSLRKEVESLLACKGEVEGFIDQPAIELAALNLADETDLRGTSLLHYRIAEKIGAGGMGEVYRARDEHLKRDVAIKVLPPELMANPERKKRFVQEARAASVLGHPKHRHDPRHQLQVDLFPLRSDGSTRNLAGAVSRRNLGAGHNSRRGLRFRIIRRQNSILYNSGRSILC
jgi:serine/threonine protein kinase